MTPGPSPHSRPGGAAPSVVLGRSGYDPIQEADAFSCPMAEPEPAPEEGREET